MADATPFYVTTPIYYVNDVPHLGSAYTSIACDALRRHALLRGRPARMLTGTDEHGLKIERRASEEGTSPRALVDRVSQRFRDAWPALEVEPDDFIRTTEPRHVAFVQQLWRDIQARGYLYEGEYDDWYCVGCESFKTEKELQDGKLCPVHLKPVERLKETSFFFKLSAFQQPLLDLYTARPELICPESRRNEVLSFVRAGLRDLSVSRTGFSWGIPVPDQPQHVMYVWFDALSNYLSALGGKDGEHGAFWPPRGHALHVVGKDILRFHAVYWPAFLLAAGYSLDQLPSQIFAHGFLTIDGHKMSKSLGNVVDPLHVARIIGAEPLRYHLLRAIAFGQDGDFSHDALLLRYNADLGKNLGNLLSRTLGLCSKFFGSTLPAESHDGELEQALRPELAREKQRTIDAWQRVEPHLALEASLSLSALLNQYIDRAAPWSSAKTDLPRAGHCLQLILRELEWLSVALWPVLPNKADQLRAQIGLEKVQPTLGCDLLTAQSQLRAGAQLHPGAPLFPTYDSAQMEALLSELKPTPEIPEAAKEATKPETTKPEAAKEAAQPIAYDDFAKVELRAGLILEAARVPKKDRLLQLKVDVGEAEPRAIVAGLALSFQPEALVGQRVIVVCNLQPRDFGKGLVSHGMLLAAGPSDALSLATVPEGVAPGTQLK